MQTLIISQGEHVHVFSQPDYLASYAHSGVVYVEHLLRDEHDLLSPLNTSNIPQDCRYKQGEPSPERHTSVVRLAHTPVGTASG